MIEIEYAKKPRKIRVENTEGGCCVCDNCAQVGHVFILKFNEISFKTPKGNIGKKRYAKNRELWLYDKCFSELHKAVGSVEINKAKEEFKDCTEEEILKSDIAMAKLARLQILGQECGSNLNETYNCLKAGLELLEFEIEVEE